MRSVYHLIIHKVLKLCAWMEYIISSKVLLLQFSCSVVSNSVTPWTAARQASLSITNAWCLLKLMSIHEWMDAIQPYHTLSSPSPPAFTLSQHQDLYQ